jgi:hypothetical protein
VTTAAYQIQTMTEKDVQLAVDWARAEGWNPGLNDAQLFYNADQQGFLMRLLDGQPIATISATHYGKHFGFIGFYIVKPEFRGHGFGLRLWQTAMSRLTERNIGLDGVVEQQENYKHSGFKLAYNNIRYQTKITVSPVTNPNIVVLDAISIETLTAYDSAHFFTPRPDFLKHWIHQPASLALGCINNCQLQGYGVIRQCGKGCKIGPLFANDYNIAEQLFTTLSAYANGQIIFLDIPEPNAAAVALAEEYHMSPIFSTARMYTGIAPSINLGEIYGVTSFELG